jgi:hypothetical protein
MAFLQRLDQSYLICKTMKITKTQLESLIRESVQKALEGLDWADREWLHTRRDDDAIRQNVMQQGHSSPVFGQMLKAAQAAVTKIQGSGNQQRIATATQLKKELEQLAQAPESGATVMKGRLITGKLIALSKQG